MNFNVKKKVILASGSPRRQELLAMLGIPFDVVKSDVLENDESRTTTNLIHYAENLAIEKAQAVAHSYPNAVIIGADTIVGLGTRVFPKPENEREAKSFLRQLSGKTHSVITAVAIVNEGETHVFSDEVFVTFYELEDALIEAYVNTGDPFDKAGAYGIQTQGALFVKEIKGDYYAVMGLPIAALLRHLQTLGIIVLQGGLLTDDN